MLVVPLLVVDQPWWAVVLGFALMQCAASLAFTLPLVSTHIAEEVAFPEADGAGYVEGCWATHQLATSMDYSPESRLANWLLARSTPTPPTTCSPTCVTSTTSPSRRSSGRRPASTACGITRCRSRRPSAPTSGS